jgi:hypothetical protein
MVEQGLPMVEVRPLVLNFSAPMKEIQELISAGRFHFNGDPVLSFCLGNVVCHVDSKSNVFPNKDREENKIDGAIALIMAMARALLSRPDGPSYYELLARERAAQAAASLPVSVPKSEDEKPEAARADDDGAAVPPPAVAPVVSTLSYWEQVALERRKKREQALKESQADDPG